MTPSGTRSSDSPLVVMTNPSAQENFAIASRNAEISRLRVEGSPMS